MQNMGGSMSKESLKLSPFQEQKVRCPSDLKKHTAYKTTIRGSLLRENALHIATRSGIENFKKNIDYITRFKQQHSKVYKTALEKCKV